MADGVSAARFGAAKSLVISLQTIEIMSKFLGAVGLRAEGGTRARNGGGGAGPRVLTERQDAVPGGLAIAAGQVQRGRAGLGWRRHGTETAVLLRAVWLHRPSGVEPGFIHTSSSDESEVQSQWSVST